MKTHHTTSLIFSLALGCSTGGPAAKQSAGTGTATDQTAAPDVNAQPSTGLPPATSTTTATPQVADCANAAKSTLSADITADKKLTGTISVTKPITIAAGANVTADDCAKFALAAGAGITVAGSFTVDGGAGAPVSFQPTDANASWAGIKVLSGGKAALTNVFIANGDVGLECQTGAAGCTMTKATLKRNSMPVHIASTATLSQITVDGLNDKGFRIDQGANATVTDAVMSGSAGDIIGVNGGTVTFTNIKVSGAHCGVHINAADRFELNNSVLTNNVFAFMVGSTKQFVVHGSNIVQSSNEHLDYIGGDVTSPDLSGSYWEGGVTPDFLNGHSPHVSGANTGNLATAAIAGAGPKTVGTGATLAGDDWNPPAARPGTACPR